MLGELVVLLAWPTTEADENAFPEIQVAARGVEDVSFYDLRGTILSAGYSRNNTSLKSLKNPIQQASAAKTLSAGLAKAKPAAIQALLSRKPHISAASSDIYSPVSMYKHFHPHVPSLYMPGLDDHIEGQRVYRNEFSRTYFKISILQTLKTSVHIFFCSNILEEATDKMGSI